MEPGIDRLLFGLARTQHGVFTRTQALEVGTSPKAIEHRIGCGRWQVLTRGVYALPGFEPSTKNRAMAATLALPGAVASHQTAAELHGFSHVPRGRTVVTAPRGTNHRSPLAHVHEYRGIDATEHTFVERIPVTTPELTVFHLAAVLGPTAVERTLDDRLNTRGVDLGQMFALSDFWARRGFPGSGLMRGLLAARGPGYVAPESALESAFVALIRRFRLPDPVRQLPTPWDPSGGRVDFAYPQLKILIEVDGRRWHGRDADNERDRARDRKAQLEGWILLRYTWHEITRLPQVVAAEIRTFLETRAAA